MASCVLPDMVTLVHMLFVDLLSWWYGLGWAKLMQKVTSRIMGVLHFFSVGQLAASLFAPYRQISAGQVNGAVGDQMRALGDRMFSRAIGAVVRTILIAAGLFSTIVTAVIGLILVITWPLFPMLPFVGLFLIDMRTG
jgi:hypothetical protein